MLRETFKLKSVKAGCAPQRECGSCVALIDGVPKVTCSVRIAQVEGRSILTLEGVSDNERRLYADAFQAAAGLQCGFCTPGLVLRIKWMTDQGHKLTRAEIARLLDGHLCRCTGYVEDHRRGRAHPGGQARRRRAPAVVEDGGVGASLKRYQGGELTLGERPFVADIDAPGLLHGVVVLSPHARARVVSASTSRKARALPGVVAVATAADVPGDRWVGQIVPRLARASSPRARRRAASATCWRRSPPRRPGIAREAAALVDVEYEPLARGARPGRGDQARRAAGQSHGTTTSCRRRATPAATSRRPWPPPPTSSAASGGRSASSTCSSSPRPASPGRCPTAACTSTRQGQGIFDDRRQVAAVLGEPEDRVFVELVPNGGAFGGKEDMTIQAQTALLARLTGRPVRIELNRERIDPHPSQAPPDHHDLHRRLRRRRPADGGARPIFWATPAPTPRSAARCWSAPPATPAGPTGCRRVAIEAVAAYTNNPPCGAMRGFGVNQTSFAIEGCLDLLAAKVGLDGWEMRWRNIVRRRRRLTTTGQVLEKSVGVEKTLLAVKPAYDAARAAGRAVGIACGLKNSGLGNGAIEYGKCRLVVQADGGIDLHTGFTEMGQGLLTVLTQCAVEVTGLPRRRLPSPGQQPLRARLRPDDRLARHHARRTRGDRRGREAARPTSTPGRTLADLAGARLRRRGPHRRHHRAGRAEERQDQDPHHLRLRDAGGGARRERRASRR